MRILKVDFYRKNKLRSYAHWLFIFLLILSQFLYWFWLRNYTLVYFDSNQKNSVTWFSDLAETMYPRLKTEKYRFEASFFIKKADQIAIRFLFVSGLFSLLLIPKFYQKAKIFFIKNSVYSEKITIIKQYFLIVYFLISNIFLSKEWLETLTEYHQIAVLYEPISFYQFLSPSFPSLQFFQYSFIFLKITTGIGISFIGLCLVFTQKIMFKVVVFFCVSINGILFIYLQGFLYGFGKIEHTYATWNWVCILLPFWIYQTNFKKSISEKKDPFNNLIPQNYLLFLAVGLIYTSAGLEKIFIGGWDWINGNALLSYLQNSPTDLGKKLSTYPLLVTILSIITILWETSFFLILHKNQYTRLVFIFIGICFHASTYFFLNVGHYFSPWIWVYIFLLNRFR